MPIRSYPLLASRESQLGSAMAYAPSWDSERGDEAPAEIPLPEDWASSYLSDPMISNSTSWMDKAAGGWEVDPSFNPALLTPQLYDSTAISVVNSDSPIQQP